MCLISTIFYDLLKMCLSLHKTIHFITLFLLPHFLCLQTCKNQKFVGFEALLGIKKNVKGQ